LRNTGASRGAAKRNIQWTKRKIGIYRHALALDEAGDGLAFGSTTGGL
jgi:hypothetical protein